MGRRDDVDVVAPHLLEPQHHRRQRLEARDGTRAPLTDLPVTAKDASQVAVAEEDGARASSPDQRPLLAEVRVIVRGDQPRRAPAEPLLTVEPGRAALPRAQLALPHAFPENRACAPELAAPVQREIRGLEVGVGAHLSPAGGRERAGAAAQGRPRQRGDRADEAPSRLPPDGNLLREMPRGYCNVQEILSCPHPIRDRHAHL
jgi:hypothetical protein